MAVLNKLGVKEVEALCKQKKVGKHADGGGLFLQISEKGGFYWRYKYRIDGKEKLASFGTYPEVSLAEARIKHHAARRQVEASLDPQHEKRKDRIVKKLEREANRPFRAIAKEYYDTMIPADAAYSTRRRHISDEKCLNAGFGNMAIADIRVADLAAVLKKVQAEGKYATRERVQIAAIRIMGFAVGNGYRDDNPFLGVKFTSAFISPSTVRKKRPALTEIASFSKLLRDIDRDPDEDEVSRISLRLLALTALRPGELARTAWSSVDFARRKLTVPANLLKSHTQRKTAKDERAGKALEVPLSRQAITELQALRKLTEGGTHLFPARKTRVWKHPHIRTATINSILLRMGYGDTHCAHGFRSSFSTLMNEERMVVEDKKVLRWPDQKALIEVQLDHNDASTKAIYDRGGRWEERCELMQLWADRIDEMRDHDKPKLTLVA